MRICIFGAGAVGGHLAARLAAAGSEVSVVARGTHLHAMQQKGITLLHGDEVIHGRVHASDDPAALGWQDAVFVTMKANLLDVFAERGAPLIGPQTAVVFAQNGIPWWYDIGIGKRRPPPDLSPLDPQAKLRRMVEAQNVLGGVIYSANEVIEPGVIKNNVPGNNMLVIGDADDRNAPRTLQLRSVLQKSGMSSPAARDIRAAIWAKLTQNLANSTLCLLTGATVSELRSDPQSAALGARLGAEGRAIAEAHGVSLALAPERPGGGHSSGMIGHKPSMLQDFERSRPMEIDAQIVMPLEFGRVAGVPTPTLEVLAPLAALKAQAKGLYKRSEKVQSAQGRAPRRE